MANDQRIKIIAIDDEPDLTRLITRILEEAGYAAMFANNGPAGLELVRREQPELVLLDLRLPGMDSLKVLKRIRELDRDLMVIAISPFESLEAAVQSMKLGAYDFIIKPINAEKMKITLQNALRTKQLSQEVRILKHQAEQRREAGQIIGACPAMQDIFRQIELASQHDISVLIKGESGTGKELLARSIHYSGRRQSEPFICLDCSTIPENLIENELFGYERGAIAGTRDRRPGQMELANHGTLFINAINNLPMAMQKKLLRAIQEREIIRQEGETPVPIDIRIIAATHQDLRQRLQEKNFCEDLFYRLHEFPLCLPTLRERGEDIVILAKYFLDKFSREFKKEIKGFIPAALAGLEAYAWPGNVRELQAMIKRAAILASDWILPEHLPAEISAAGRKLKSPALLIETDLEEIRPIKEVIREVVSRVESELIKQTLVRSQGNKVKTARRLGIDYKTLFNKLKQYHITVEPHTDAAGSIKNSEAGACPLPPEKFLTDCWEPSPEAAASGA